MIVCVEGSSSRFTKPDGAPGFDIIQDPVVAYACGVVFTSPDLPHAEAQLQKILDPDIYTVGHGGSHVFVAKDGQRLAMLVDSDDNGIRWSFPALPAWQWPWP